MGRKPTVNLNLPKGMRSRKQRSGRIYYYFDHGEKPRRETPLGSDFIAALKKYAELMPTMTVAQPTFGDAARRYLAEVVPTKALGTQRNNRMEMLNILKFFDDPPATFGQIKPIRIRQYLDWRRDHPYAANREKALFSHTWNKAREWGITDLENPCRGIKGHPEPGSDVYVENDDYLAVWEHADIPTQECMDLIYCWGQRKSDVLNASEKDIIDEVLKTKQAKTGNRVDVAMDEGVLSVLERIRERKKVLPICSMRLLVDEKGQPMTEYKLRYRFNKARKAAGIHFTLRDLRAKAGTDKAILEGILAAQKLLGHSAVTTTNRYVRKRKGETQRPLPLIRRK